MKTVTVHHGDNGSQEYWETVKDDSPRVVLFRNHFDKEGRWLAQVGGEMVTDKARTARARRRLATTWCGLYEPSAEAVARRLERYRLVRVLFTATPPLPATGALTVRPGRAGE